MKQELIDDIRDKSQEVLNQYDDLTRMESSDEEYAKSIAQKKKEDDANRKNFLKFNAEMTGLSLEFRNIYGVEPLGVYKEGSYSVRKTDANGNLLSDKNGKKLYEYYKDGRELVYASEMPKDSLFFVDAYNDLDSSNFHVPYNPPQYKAWTGDKVYYGLSRRFYRTEKMMYRIINNLYIADNSPGPSENDWITYYDRYFDYQNPAYFYSNQRGDISCDKYSMVISGDLVPPGGGTYVCEPSQEPIIKKESIMYNLSSLPAGLAEGEVLSFRLTFSPSRVGLAYVALIENGKVLLDILSYNYPLQSKPISRKRWRKWFKREPYTDPNRFYIQFSESVKKDTALIEKLLLEYKTYYIDEILYYITQIENPSESTKKSIADLRVMEQAFKTYNNGGSLSALMTAMENRITKIYGVSSWPFPWVLTSPPRRAKDINNEMKNSEIFDKVYQTILPRIDKRTGTLRELRKYEFNYNEAKKMMELKEMAIEASKGVINVYRLIVDANGSNYIQISLERDTEDTFYNHLKWLSEVYIVCDDKNIPPLLVSIEDIVKNDDTEYQLAEDVETEPMLTIPNKRDILIKSGSMTLKMSEPIPTYFTTGKNSRMVRLL